MATYSLNDTSGVKVADITEKTQVKGRLLRIEEKRFHEKDFVNRFPIFENGYFSIAGTAYKPIHENNGLVLISNLGQENIEEHCIIVSINDSPLNEETYPFKATIYIK